MSDVELEADTDAHYLDTAYYSAAYADRSADVSYYTALAAAHGGPVLEYGCGTGRISLPMARLGLTVTGVDRSSTMLTGFRRALRAEDEEVRQRLTLRKGDMRKLSLKQRFPLVLCTFNTFLHLYNRDDVERFCARVRKHLTSRGRFIVDVTVPDPNELSRSPERIYRLPRFRHPSGAVVRYGERFDYDSLRQVLLINMEFEPLRQPRDSWSTPLAHRQFYPQELEALLHYNGLEVVDVHGDYAEGPPSGDACELIYHCRKRRGW